MNIFFEYLKNNYYRVDERIKILVGKYYKIYVKLYNKKYGFSIILEIITKNLNLKILKKINSLKITNKYYKKSNIILTYKIKTSDIYFSDVII